MPTIGKLILVEISRSGSGETGLSFLAVVFFMVPNFHFLIFQLKDTVFFCIVYNLKTVMRVYYFFKV